VPVKDTIKYAADGIIIDKTVERSFLWSALTPQVFERELIRNAHQQARQACFKGTDDASLVENAGGSVHIVRGSYNNIKITTREDLVFAKAILESMRCLD